MKGSSYAHVGVPAGPQSSPRGQILEERQGIEAASVIRKQRAGWRRPARFMILCITDTEEALPSFCCKLVKSFINCHLSLLLPNKYETMTIENDVSGLTLHN